MNKNKILEKIGTILISITIIVFSVIIGANEKEIRTLPISILLAVTIIYLIAKKIITKEKVVIKNKVDIFAIFFVISTMLPLIFKTYCSFQGTIEFITKYCYIYSFYLLVRNSIKSKKQIDIISLVTVTASLIIIAFGLDMLWKDGTCFKLIIKKLNLLYKGTIETRSYFSSTFGYRNTAAIYFSFCVFLAINQVQTSKSKIIKAFCVAYILLASYIIYLTGSRAVTLLFGIFIILYFIIYYKDKIKENKKIFLKILIPTFIIVLIMANITINVLTKKSKEYEFDEIDYLKTLNYKFEANTEYTLNVEIESPNNQFKISIIEMNEYYVENILVSENVENGTGNIEIKFKTTDNVTKVDFSIDNPNKEKIILKKFYINGEECIQHFKYIPDSLGKMLKLGVTTDPSIIQRIEFWKDSIKIFKEHPIIGQGGDTWKNVSMSVEEYPYSVKETHSYFFELLIEYGIVGVGLFIMFIIAFIITYVKKNTKSMLSIFVGIILILTHSLLFDFNMSFILIQLLVWGYIGVLISNVEEINEKKYNFMDLLVIIMMSVILIILLITAIAQNVISNQKIKKTLAFYIADYQYKYIVICNAHDEDERMVIQELQSLINKNPYFMQNVVYELYWEQIEKEIDEFSEEELSKYIEFINSKYKNIKFETPMYVTSILSRVEPMANGYLELVKKDYTNVNLIEQINILKEIIINEYEKNIKNIEDIQRNGLSREKAKEIVRQYDEIISSII